MSGASFRDAALLTAPPVSLSEIMIPLMVPRTCRCRHLSIVSATPSLNGLHYLTYRLAERAEDNRLPALYGFAESNPATCKWRSHFDSADRPGISALILSINTGR